MKTKKLIIGIALIMLSIVIAYGATYVYEYFEGNKGREFVTVMFGVLASIGLIMSAIGCIYNYYEN